MDIFYWRSSVRTKIVSCNNKEALIIYTDKLERYTPQVEECITKSKKQYEEVVIFVSGDNELETVLYTLIYDKCNIS
jgi:hypothetical protein